MQMKLEFPANHGQILSAIKVSYPDGEYTQMYAPDTVITFTLHTPDGDFTYTIDNKAKTLTTESDTPFLA